MTFEPSEKRLRGFGVRPADVAWSKQAFLDASVTFQVSSPMESDRGG